MTSLRQCEVCGTAIAPGPLGDVCPVCLLREGHTDFTGAGASAFQDRGALPRDFGSYELLAEIAHGGMGIVYRARHRALNREVALKLLLAGAFASPEFVRRFQREAAAAAGLRHPHIVGVYEVGEVGGQPFLAMEYVAGKTLAERVRDHPLPAREAARYLQTVAEAVQHAHDHGLLHRDLKPSNVLVDRDDQPRVTDFGLAKQMDGSTDLTVTGQMLGSPNYLSPEAALGHEAQLTPASDVYSLGATLYHLLTGRPPLLAGSLAETLVQVREQTAIAPRLLNPAIPADLETICLKCLEKEPAHRYAAAQELADELGRWRRGEPIHARPAGPIERAGKWACRYPARAALLGTVLLALAAVVGTSLWFNFRLTLARDESEKNRRLSETNRLAAEASAAASHERLIRLQVLTGNRLAAEGDPFAAGLWFAEALRQEAQAVTHSSAERSHRHRLAGVWASAPRLVGLYEGRFSYPHVGFAPGGRWLALGGTPPRLVETATGRDAAWFAGEPRSYAALEFSASGNRMLELSGDPARLWRVPEDGTTNATWVALPTASGILAVFSPDGTQFVTGGSTVRFWDAETGLEKRSPLPAGVSAKNLAFPPDGRLLLVRAVEDSSSRVWNLETDQPVTPVIPGDYFGLAPEFRPDGQALLATRRDGERMLLELHPLAAGAAPRRAWVDSVLYDLSFDPTGRWLATAHWDGQVRLWSADTLEPEGVPMPHPGGVSTLAFSPDGTRLAAGGWGNEVRVWSVPEGRAAAPPLRVGAQVSRVGFSPDGRYLLAVVTERLVRVWDLFVAAPAELPSGEAHVAALAVSSRGVIAGWDADGRGHFWQPATSEGRATFRHRVITAAAGTGLGPFEFDATGERLATADPDGGIQVWVTGTGERLHQFRQGASRVTRVGFSPDGRWLLAADEAGRVRRWHLSEGRELEPPLQHAGAVHDAAFSPDSQRVLTGSADGTARVWDFATGAPASPPLQHDSEVIRVAFSPDGRRFLTAMSDEGATALYARLWDAGTFTATGARMEHTDGVAEARFLPGGTRIVTAGEDGLARLWDAATGEPRSPWMRCDRRILRLEASPDGRIVATVDDLGRLRVWDADTGEPLGAPPADEPVFQVRFFDASRLVLADASGLVRLWELPVADGPVADLGDLARLAAGHEIDVAGGLSFLPPARQFQLFERLRANRPEAFQMDLFNPEWHRQEARRAAAAGNAHAEQFHRRRMAHGAAGR